MKYIGNGIIILLCIAALIYNVAKDSNPVLSKKIYGFKKKLLLEKLKLNIDISNKPMRVFHLVGLGALFALSFLLDGKMILVIAITAIELFLFKGRMSRENFEKVFANRKHGLKEYNKYLAVILFLEALFLLIALFLLK